MYRVRLRCGPLPGSDYINASFVNVRSTVTCTVTIYFLHIYCQGYKQKGAYIAAQCPLENTVTDFWRMINEFQCGCIVMLCQLQEEGQVNLTPLTSHPYTRCGCYCRRVATVSGQRRKESLCYMEN